MFFKIIGETARTGSFVARYMEIFASKCTIGEMDFGVCAVHPCAAKPGPPQNDGSVALPTGRIAIFATDREADGGRTLPFPVPEEFVQLRRGESTHGLWSYCAIEV